jgi:molecular chaperone Hsp33
MLDAGLTPEKMLEEILGEMDLEITDTMPVSYACNCSKERFTRGLISIGAKDIKEMIDDNEPITVNCHFCNTDYTFSIEELKEILRAAKH